VGLILDSSVIITGFNGSRLFCWSILSCWAKEGRLFSRLPAFQVLQRSSGLEDDTESAAPDAVPSAETVAKTRPVHLGAVQSRSSLGGPTECGDEVCRNPPAGEPGMGSVRGHWTGLVSPSLFRPLKITLSPGPEMIRNRVARR